MTHEEAINIIRIAIAEVEWNYPLNYAEAFDKAILSLDKQIKRKPNNIRIRRNFISFDCPICGTQHVYANEGVMYSYCSVCGQAIDYSNIFEEDK